MSERERDRERGCDARGDRRRQRGTAAAALVVVVHGYTRTHRRTAHTYTAPDGITFGQSRYIYIFVSAREREREKWSLGKFAPARISGRWECARNFYDGRWTAFRGGDVYRSKRERKSELRFMLKCKVV